LIGTAIATALLPTLSEQFAAEDQGSYKNTIERALKVMIALSLPLTVLISMTTLPLIQRAFGFPVEDAQMIFRAAQAYLVGLLGHSVVELGVRAFYAKQNAKVPMLVSGLGLLVYLGLAIPLMQVLSFGGIALANSISYSIQALVLILLLNRRIDEKFGLKSTFFRAFLSAIVVAGVLAIVLFLLPLPISDLFLSFIVMGLGAIVGVIPIWPEIRTLVQL